MIDVVIQMKPEDVKLMNDYVSSKNTDISEFIRNLILDKLEEDSRLDEERILRALEKSKTEESYDHTEVWERLGI